jgi:hypothetical protein
MNERRRPPTVFISYPHAIYDWAQETVYEPLVARCGRDAVFMDVHANCEGGLLIEHLTRPVVEARVFLPIWCPAYFSSKWCRWELAMRLSLDPLCEEKPMLAVAYAPATLPEYCRLFTVLDGRQADVSERILAGVRQILGSGSNVSRRGVVLGRRLLGRR